MIRIIAAGPLCTVQDEGRTGWQELGFPQTGAADQKAMYLANLLVGNDPGEGVLEMTVKGITAQFFADCTIALTGAEIPALLNGNPISSYTAIPVTKGSILHMAAAVSGCRGYLAVSGGFALDKEMGSLSTGLKFGVGGFHGRKLRQKDELPLKAPKILPDTKNRTISRPVYEAELSIRAIPGPQDDYFTEQGMKTFFSAPYRVTPASDRMGIRLEGETLDAALPMDIVSDGIAPGSVQVPGNGQPIILLCDRQTTGGYAKIATVYSGDLSKLAQAVPGTVIRFQRISLSDAHKALREDQNTLNKMAEALHQPPPFHP